MRTKVFQRVLQNVESGLFATTNRLPLPKGEEGKGYDTPYLRRRMQSRLRGLYG